VLPSSLDLYNHLGQQQLPPLLDFVGSDFSPMSERLSWLATHVAGVFQKPFPRFAPPNAHLPGQAGHEPTF
jgi:hypothetical protein